MFAKLSVAVITLLATTTWAQSLENSENRTKSSTAHQTQLILPNAIVTDHRSHEHRLLDLLQDQITIVNFVFTSCTTICPVLSATMQALEKLLQDELGKRVILVSISVDSASDAPEKLSEHAKKLDAGQHWYWLTGRSSDMDPLLKAFGIPIGRPEDHPPVILAGNASVNNWLRWVGIPSPETIIEAIDVLTRDNLQRK